MTTTYIDLNAANAKIINEKNNRFNVQMNNGMRLPTGTQVSVQNSFINYQGVVGASIEIREQIVEEVAFGYYKTDTFDEEPYITDIRATGYYQKLPQNDREKRLLQNMGQVAGNGFQPILKDARINANPSLVVPQANRGALETLINEGKQLGGTETCLPVGTLYLPPAIVGDVTLLIPSTFRARIQIEPGVYSVEELAVNITDQINGAKIASQNNKSSREVWNEDPNTKEALDPATNMFTNTYCHCPSNVEDYLTGPTYNILTPGFKTLFETFINEGNAATRATLWNDLFLDWIFNVAIFTTPKNVTEDNFTEAGNYNTLGLGVTQELMKKSFELLKTVPEAEWTTLNPLVASLRPENFLAKPNVTTVSSFGSLTVPQNNIVPPIAGLGITIPPNITGNNGAVIGNNKFMVGTTRFNVKYDNPSSLYTVSGAHQDRKQPSHDMFGNTMPSPGQTSIYHKQIRNNLDASSQNQNLFGRAFSKYMTRLGGIYIYNWAVKTAKAERTNNDSGANPYSEDYYRFDEFFNGEEDARNAWSKTLWSRLGFTYDQFQNPSGWRDHQPLLGENENFIGFTTDMKIDSSIASSISSTYGGPRTAKVKAGDSIFPGVLPSIISDIDQPDITTVATYNLLGINVPDRPATASSLIYKVNNNTQENVIVKTDTFQSGFYLDATMRPIITAEVAVKAVTLPRLNNAGYFLITSDSLQNTDMISQMSPSCILDVVPISSLASTDFISNRNEMVHTITNPKFLDTIDINIVYPDGTDPSLQANSAVLLKIVTPLPPITNILAQGQAQQALAAVEQQGQQSQKEKKKK